VAVLGLGGSDHDFSAAIIDDGCILVAVEDERLQRVKQAETGWHARPAHDATEYCLEAAGLKLDELDGIFCCDDLERPSRWLDWSQVTFVNHHAAHAAASFFTSAYEASALLVIDGHGSPVGETDSGYEVETISVGSARDRSLDLYPLQTGEQKKTSSCWRYVAQNSIGWFYGIITIALGFGEAGQGKTMGLAAYGTPARLDELAQFIHIGSRGEFQFDPYGGIWDWLTTALAEQPSAMRVRADIAWAAQQILGDAVVAAANEAHRRAPSNALCFGGGCALNTLANTRILEETPFKELSIFPAAADNGLSVGAAFYGAHVLLGQPRRRATVGWRGRVVFTGRDYTDQEIDLVLSGAPVTASCPADLPSAVARILIDGDVVAVCRGRSEMGPRALGNRSLLALPCTTQIRDHINVNIKERESFRPLAPVVPLAHAHAFFTGVEESPYMLLVADVRVSARAQLAAVTHVDGTARLQTVRPEDNPFLHHLLEVIGRLTGVPVLLNTSLNLRGEPIVETPSDAMSLFVRRPIGALVLGDRLVRKYSPWADPSLLAAAQPAVAQGHFGTPSSEAQS
jgi:carbamoyltransferase